MTLAAATRRMPTPARPRDYALTAGRGGPASIAVAPVPRRHREPARCPQQATGRRPDDPRHRRPPRHGGAVDELRQRFVVGGWPGRCAACGRDRSGRPGLRCGRARGERRLRPERRGGDRGRRERRTPGACRPAPAPRRAGRVARCRELAAEPGHDPGPAPTVAGDGCRATDQRQRQGDRLGRPRRRSRGEPRWRPSSTSSGPSLSLISAVLLAVGLVLFGIRRVARRAGDR